MNYSSDSENESEIRSMTNESLLRKMQKLFTFEEEYFGENTDSEEIESPNGRRLNVQIEEITDIKEPEESFEPYGEGTSHYNREKMAYDYDESSIEWEKPKREPHPNEYFDERYDNMHNPYADAFMDASQDGIGNDPTLPNIPRVNPVRRKSYKTPRIPRRRQSQNPEYQPKGNYNTYHDDILDLDCVLKRDEEIDGWSKKMGLLLATNYEKFQTLDQVTNFLEHKTSGIVSAWWNTTGHDYIEAIKKEVVGLPYEQQLPIMVQRIQTLLYNEFLGVNRHNAHEATEAAVQARAKFILENIKMCDICYWRQYTCEFEKWYYKLSKEDQAGMASRYFMKLPPLWADDMNKRWLNRPPHITEGLAGRVRLLQEVIEEKCKVSNLNNTLAYFNNRPCCDPAMLDIPNQWGCNRIRRKSSHHKKNYSSKKKYRRYKPKYRKYRKKDNSSYKKSTFRKRKSISSHKYDKKENCPKGKKSCRCWLCQEEGHYANECPKKGQKPVQARKLQIINRLNLEPIESSDNSETEYEVEFEEEEMYFSSDPGMDWELVESDEEWKLLI